MISKLPHPISSGGQIIEIGAILVDDDLNELDRSEVKM